MIADHLADYFDPFDWDFIDAYLDFLAIHEVYGVEGYGAWCFDVECRYFDLSFVAAVLDATGNLDSGLL